jgi:hypothetical protein
MGQTVPAQRRTRLKGDYGRHLKIKMEKGESEESIKLRKKGWLSR